MKTEIAIRLAGSAQVVADRRWCCVKCGRDFKMPKIPGTCETIFSICMTCFQIQCIEEIPEDTENC